MSPIKRFTPFALILMLLGLSGCSDQDAHQHNGKVQQWPLNVSCDLHQQACQTTFNNQSITLDVTPKPIPVARMLDANIDIKGIAQDNPIEEVALDISGVNMYMGYNRVTFNPTKTLHSYEGKSMLAFCTIDEMEWQLTVLVKLKNGHTIQAPFLLKTTTRPPQP